MKFVSKEAQNSNIAAAILITTQRPGHNFITSIYLRDFVQMTSKSVLITPLGYGCS